MESLIKFLLTFLQVRVCCVNFDCVLPGLYGLFQQITDFDSPLFLFRHIKYEKEGLICKDCLCLEWKEDIVDSVYCLYLEFVNVLRSEHGFLLASHRTDSFSSLYKIRRRGTKVINGIKYRRNILYFISIHPLKNVFVYRHLR